MPCRTICCSRFPIWRRCLASGSAAVCAAAPKRRPALPNCATTRGTPMDFAQRHAISDTCILVCDLEASIAFYRDRLGFKLLHRAPGFADFTGAGHTLALWERAHIAGHTGAPLDLHAPAGLAIAIKLPDVASLDDAYEELAAKGVAFVNPP